MVTDYITGSVAAAHSGEWSSAAARSGIWHKAGMVVAVSLGLDILIGMILGNIPAITLPFEYSVLICPLVLVWYVLTELGSILENAGAMGAPMPAFLRKMLAALQGAAEGAGDKLTGEAGKK
ncbi:MAG: holin family protein [Ruthenibacterium sp.]